MRLNRIIILTIVLALIFSFSPIVNAVDVSAKYACVIDSVTGKVIYEKDGYTRHSMASTTKIMTAIVAIENSNLNDIVTVEVNPTKAEGSSLYLKKGDKVKMENLLYGLMLHSGNDAAIAIAEGVSGSVDKFVALMNEKAKEIGANNTCFKNPNGLDADGHYTTAYDLALITRYALNNNIFKEIVSTKTKTIQFEETNEKRYLTNHNKMLSKYTGCIGVKTGFTKKTGRCLVTGASADGATVIAVTLNAPDDWNDHTRMLDYAFSRYSKRDFVAEGQVIKNIDVKGGTIENIDLIVNKRYQTTILDNDISDYKMTLKVTNSLKAPINKGEKVGILEIKYKDKVIDTIDVLANEDVYKKEVSTIKEQQPQYLNQFKNVLKSWLMQLQL